MVLHSFPVMIVTDLPGCLLTWSRSLSILAARAPLFFLFSSGLFHQTPFSSVVLFSGDEGRLSRLFGLDVFFRGDAGRDGCSSFMRSLSLLH